jgi:hypothetical protein
MAFFPFNSGRQQKRPFQTPRPEKAFWIIYIRFSGPPRSPVNNCYDPVAQAQVDYEGGGDERIDFHLYHEPFFGYFEEVVKRKSSVEID